MRGFDRLDDFEPFEFWVAECERLALASMLMGGAKLFGFVHLGEGAQRDRAHRVERGEAELAAVSLGLAERRGRSVYGLEQLGAALAGNRAALSLIEHQPLLYADLQDPVALLRGSPRGTGIARFWPYSAAAHPTELAEEEVASYSALMTASQPLIAQEVLDSYPIHRHRCLLDVGGGEGVFLAAAATRVPALRLMLFDLPAVVEQALVPGLLMPDSWSELRYMEAIS